MKNVLIVGGAGYIGSHTLWELKQNGYQCIVFDNLIYGHRQAVLDAVFEQGDLLNKSDLKNVFEKYAIDAVIHFAAYTYVGESVQNPRKYYENNVVGTLNLLNTMMDFNVKKIVFSSTCATYGEPKYTPIDEQHPQNPINPYGCSKLMIEKILADYHRAYGLKYIALRYFNASGALEGGAIGESHTPETHLIPLVLKAIKGDIDHISVFGTDYPTPDGTCIRDYIHVSDLAVAHRLALEKLDSFSGCLNLGTGIGTSVKEIIDSAERITGQKCPLVHADRRAGDPAVLMASNQKAKSVLGWEIRYNHIDDIIKTAWEWEQNKFY